MESIKLNITSEKKRLDEHTQKSRFYNKEKTPIPHSNIRFYVIQMKLWFNKFCICLMANVLSHSFLSFKKFDTKLEGGKAKKIEKYN